MVLNKSLDNTNIIAALLHDIFDAHGLVSNTRALKNTQNKVFKRTLAEGQGFLTKTLPRLGKAFDKALSGYCALNSTEHGFEPMPGSKLPRFLGELFERVLAKDGTILPNPDAECVKSIRLILYLFYKYELPYEEATVQQVLTKFERTEEELTTTATRLDALHQDVVASYKACRTSLARNTEVFIAREAKALLEKLFYRGPAYFDPTDIFPKHGPGAVATRQKLWDKYDWKNVCSRITDYYPFDEYFCSSLGHVCDTFDRFHSIGTDSLPARVVLVPKDSRGPRLISCEPVDFQWIQQGLGRAMVQHVENSPYTKYNVFFTDQGPNQRGALLGSKYGSYATLDLNEASDRVSLSLVRLIFPDNLIGYLEACRSTSTVLPNGKEVKLTKYAPMGSCLCFPVLALTVWALLTAGAPDADTRERILVYGDDVIVPTAYAADAMRILESFGLKINRDKSCTSGLFRESCGTDAFQGVNVTPVRLRTVWSSSPRPDVYSSWIAYANSFYDRRCYRTYDLIVEKLLCIYKEIPDDEIAYKRFPSLRQVPESGRVKRKRYNKSLQKLEYMVRVIKSPVLTHEMSGWNMLLRFFTESGAAISSTAHSGTQTEMQSELNFDSEASFSVRQYTSRNTSMLVKRWR